MVLHPLMQSPGKWIFDEILPLKKQRKMQKLNNQGGYIGEIYMQAVWIPTDFTKPIANPPALKQNLKKILEKDIPISGTLVVVV